MVLLIDKVSVSARATSEWPFNVPAVRALVGGGGLSFTAPITVLVGENGTGKSTLIEAIAEAYGLDVRGGHGARKYATTVPAGELGTALKVHRTAKGMRFYGRKAKGFFLRGESAFGMLNFMSDYGVSGYGEQHAALVSHGEGYKQVFAGRFVDPGLYLLDEAEGPLSFVSTIQLIYQLLELTSSCDAQVIYATHSPIVAATPGAQVVELTSDGISERRWEELDLVQHWRRFLDRPGFYLER